MVILLMGVSGSGKSAVGGALAEHLGWPFFDGDALHPPSNIRNMRAGLSLTDEDRHPWLRDIRSLINRNDRSDKSAIVACSALKQAYRDILARGARDVRVVCLRGDLSLTRERINGRTEHFFSSNQLEGDLLEEPVDALTVDVDQDIPSIVRAIEAELMRS